MSVYFLSQVCLMEPVERRSGCSLGSRTSVRRSSLSYFLTVAGCFGRWLSSLACSLENRRLAQLLLVDVYERVSRVCGSSSSSSSSNVLAGDCIKIDGFSPAFSRSEARLWISRLAAASGASSPLSSSGVSDLSEVEPELGDGGE